MTFRIDLVELNKDGWGFNIKGIKGAGVYGDLQTGHDGSGLYLIQLSELFEWEEVEQLLSEEEFKIPLGSTREEAARILARGLHRLGWGPELDQLHRIIDPNDGA